MTDDKTRAEFEKEFPLPDDCEWDGIEAYCWVYTRAPHPHNKHWEGWQAAKERYGQKPVIARSLPEWHEDDGPVLWWEWCGNDWAGEPAWAGTPLDDDWPGYHTHWTPHPKQPTTKE